MATSRSSELLTWRRSQGSQRFPVLRVEELAVPKDIADYLSGIGDVTDFVGVPWTLKLGVALDTNPVNGLTGHYGKVDASTHIHYETVPSPFVALA